MVPGGLSVGLGLDMARGLVEPCRHSLSEQTSIIGKCVSLLNAAFRSNKEGACQISTGSLSSLLFETFKCLRDLSWNK